MLKIGQVVNHPCWIVSFCLFDTSSRAKGNVLNNKKGDFSCKIHLV